jgi:hypothetical protein
MAKQFELPLPRQPEPDRNAAMGGKSFYFFDLDDNVFHLPTTISIFHKQTGVELELSTAEYALHHSDIGKFGRYGEYQTQFDGPHGSYRKFRDHPGINHFEADLLHAISEAEFKWKGPSWNFFLHAVFNGRALSLITARGHHPDTLEKGLQRLIEAGHLVGTPNYLGIFPVSHPETRKALGDKKEKWGVPELKHAAIVRSVQIAMQKYGENPHHRFGMSDDDPRNIELIIDAMRVLKRKYPKNSFFVIDSKRTPIEKEEVFLDHTERAPVSDADQLTLI